MSRKALPIVAVLLVGAIVAAFTVRSSGTAPAVVPAAPDFVISGTVTRVIDGDTIDVRLGSGPEKVRLYGIDAPEARAPYGREATRALRELLAAGAVKLRPVSDDPYDPYDRMIAVVYADGVNVNEALVAGGLAWAFRRYLGQFDGDERYCELEAEARAARTALWSQPVERWVPPWIYRKRQKAPPGAQVPAADYSQETAMACVAAIGKAGDELVPDLPPGAAPLPDSQHGHPAGCDIKGNINARGKMIYHLPGSKHYPATQINTAKGERWFCSEQQAQAAGWRAVRPAR